MHALEHIKILYKRLERIEAHLGLSASTSVAQPVDGRNETKTFEPEASISSSPVTSFSSASLLGVVAVICLVVASIFIIRLAIESGWLTPARQVGLTTVVGMVLVFAGVFLEPKDSKYASLLSAAGVIVLYIATLGANIYFGLIHTAIAVIFAGIISLLSIWLFSIFRNDLFAVCAAIGSYVSPVVLGFEWGNFSDIALYFLGWSTCFSIISIFVRSRSLVLVASYFGVGLLGFLSIVGRYPESSLSFIAISQLLQFVILLLGLVGYSIANKVALSKSEALLLYPALLFFYVSEYSVLETAFQDKAPFIMLLVAALVVAAYLAGKKFVADILASKSLVEGFAAIAILHSLYIEILTDAQRPLLLIALLALSLYRSKDSQSTLSSMAAILSLIVVMVVEYGSVTLNLIDSFASSNESLWIAYGCVISGLLLLKGISESRKATTKFSTLLFILGHSLLVAVLYATVADAGSLALSMAWLCYAGLVLFIGFRLFNAPLAKSSLAVLFFSVAKVFLYDVANASPVIRILCLFLTAGVLYGCGWVLRIIERWNVPTASRT